MYRLRGGFKVDERSHSIDALREIKFPIMHRIAFRAKFYDNSISVALPEAAIWLRLREHAQPRASNLADRGGTRFCDFCG